MTTTVGDPQAGGERAAAVSVGGRSLTDVLAENDALRRELDAARALVRRLEDELDAARRLSGFGRLAGSVAHDFSNVMSVIAGYTELMLRRIPAGDPLQAGAQAIQKATAWGLNLSEHVLARSRAQGASGDPTDLNAVVSSVVGTLQPLLGAGIELGTSLDPAVGRVSAPAGHLEQIVMNLVLNARDAMPAGGRLTVDTARAEFAEAVTGAQRAGVRLRVSDTGVGMDPTTLARVFEPYFTTKPHGKGTGLGLTTVLALATQHGGRVDATSAPGAGTVFSVYLPCAPEPAPLAAPTPGAGRTVLVVDDDSGVRELIREILELHDYRVLEAGDADEAFRASLAHDGSIAVVIADVHLPGVPGPLVVERLLARHPTLRALFVSGDLEGGDGHRPMLRKPFSVDALVRAVAAVVGDGGSLAS
jgi:signal transduction histidine kinase